MYPSAKIRAQPNGTDIKAKCSMLNSWVHCKGILLTEINPLKNRDVLWPDTHLNYKAVKPGKEKVKCDCVNVRL